MIDETSRSKKAVKNLMYNILNQILSLILVFISRTIFIKFLGIEYLGINGLFSDVLGMLSLADLGIGTAVVFSYYKPLAEKNTKKISSLVFFYKKLYRWIACVTLIIGLLIIPLIPKIINLDKNINDILIFYILALLNVVVSYLYVYKSSLLTADQKNYIIVKINMILSMISTVLQILSLILFKSYILYLIVAIIATLSKNVIASLVVDKEYNLNRNVNRITSEEKKNIIDNVFSVFLYKISSVLLNMTDNILISIIVGTIAVGYYSNYLMLSNKITQLYALFFSSLVASIGNLVVKESKKKAYSVFQAEQTISFILSSIVFPCFLLLANDFIKLWLGKKYILEPMITVAIGCNLYLACIYHPLWSFREATGLYKKTKWIMLICGIVNIILSIALGQYLGMFGIIIASCLSRVVTYVMVEPRILYSEYFDVQSREFYYNILKNMGVVIIITILSWLITRILNIINWRMWLFKSIIIVLVSLIISVLFYRKSEGLRIVIERIGFLWKK